MKITVDATKCQAYGRCVEIAPDLFELDEWGYAVARADGEIPPGRADAALEAVQECPAKAIAARQD